MADEDLKKILGDGSDTTPPAEKKEPVQAPELSEEDQELKRKEEQKANLDKAIVEAQETLRKTRKAAKAAKSEPEEDDEEIPVIDLKDPSAKAWDRRIKEHVAPAQRELDQEKEEVFNFTFREYLKEHPSLASNEAKRNELLTTYERIKKSSGRTQEGVRLDLDSAFGATFHEELINAARSQRVDNARNDMLFSDPAVSRGTTAYSGTKPSKPQYSDDEKAIIARWEGAGAPKVE